jgi:hypothetical protein
MPAPSAFRRRSHLYALSFGALALLLPSRLSAAPHIPEVRAYQIGEKAEADIITPVTLAINDADLLEPQPIVFVYDSNSVVEAEASLRSTFSRVRGQFLDNLQTASKTRKLIPEQTGNPGFVQFVTWFENQHKDLPVTYELAEVWATGEPDDAILAAWSDALVAAMNGYLASELPASAADLQIITIEERNKLQGSNLVQRLEPGKLALPLRSVAAAKDQLIRKFSPEAAATGEFLARFIKENCTVDRALSALAAQSRKTTLGVTYWYDAGQVIVRRGETIDAPAKAAIDLLRAKRQQALAEASENWSERVDSARKRLNEWLASAAAWSDAQWKEHPRFGLALLGAIAILAVFWVTFRLTRPQTPRRFVYKEDDYGVLLPPESKQAIFLPTRNGNKPQLRIAPTASAAVSPKPTPDAPPQIHDLHPYRQVPAGTVYVDWESRVQATERRAEELLGMVRAGLAPHLAKEMMSELVRKLISDRAGLLRAQNVAAQEIAQIEQRFARVHAELQERLNQYQARNAELEKQLQARTEQNRQLLSTQIDALQKKLGVSPLFQPGSFTPAKGGNGHGDQHSETDPGGDRHDSQQNVG